MDSCRRFGTLRAGLPGRSFERSLDARTTMEFCLCHHLHDCTETQRVGSAGVPTALIAFNPCAPYTSRTRDACATIFPQFLSLSRAPRTRRIQGFLHEALSTAGEVQPAQHSQVAQHPESD